MLGENLQITAQDINTQSDELKASLTAAITSKYGEDKGLDKLLEEIKKQKLISNDNYFRKLKSPKFILPNEEDGDIHKQHVEESLEEIIRKNDGKPVALISHGGTSRRLVEYFHMPDGANIGNSHPYHAYSNDSGKTWQIDMLSIKNGELERTQLTPDIVKKGTQEADEKITLEEILKKDLSKIGTEMQQVEKDSMTLAIKIADGKHTFTVKLGKISPIGAIDPTQAQEVYDALGNLLIGELYKDQKTTGLDKDTITIELNEKQTEILKKFAELKNIKLSPQQRQLH